MNAKRSPTRRLLRYVGFGLLNLLVLVVVVALAVPLFFDPNDYKDTIAEQVKARTGRTLTITGDMAVSVLPWLGVRVGEVSLGNAQGFGDEAFARVQSAEVRVKLIPLLSRDVQMDTVSVRGLELNLARDASGRGNWEDLVQPPGEPPAGEPPVTLAAFALGGVNIEDAAVRYADAASGEQITVSDLDLRTGEVSIGEPVDAQVSLRFTHPQGSGKAAGKARVAYDLGAQRYGAQGLELDAELTAAALGQGTAKGRVTGDLVYDAGARVATANTLALTLDTPAPPASGLAGPLALKLNGDLTYREAERSVQAQGLKASLNAPAPPGSPLEGPVAVELAGDVTFHEPEGSVDARGLKASLNATAAPASGLAGPLAVEVAGDVTFRQAEGTATGRGLNVSVNGSAAPGGPLSGPVALALAGDVDLDLKKQSVASPGLSLDLQPVKHGDVTASAKVHTGLEGNYQSMRFALKGLRGEGQAAGGRLGDKPMPVKLAGDVLLDLPGQTLAVDALRLESPDLKAEGDIKVAGLTSKPVASGTIAAPAFNPRRLAALAGVSLPATRDPKVFGSAAVRTRFQAGAERVSLSDMRAELDGAAIQGSLQAGASAPLVFDLTVDRLDADRYLPPEATTAPPPSAAGAIPVDTIRKLDIDGKLKAGQLRYAGIDLSKVALGVKAKGGQLHLSPLQADLFGGQYKGDIKVDARGDTPVIQVDERIANVDAAAMLKALKVDTGALDLSGGRSSLALKARVTSDAAGKRVLASGIVLDGAIASPAFRGGPAPVSLRGDVALDLDKRDAVLEKVQAGFAELRAAGSMRIGFAPGKLSYAGSLDVPRFNPRSLAARLGIPAPGTADPAALTAVGGSATVEGTDTRLKATDVRLTVDASTITGNVNVENFANPALAFAVDVDRLDLDRYLPPATKGAATPGAAATALPVDLVRSLNVDGTLKVGALRVGGVQMSRVQVTAVAKDGLLRMSPLAAALYGGRYDGNVSVDARGQAAKVSLDETIQGVQIGPLLKDVTGDVPITGATDLRAVLTATGGDTAALKRTVNGDVRFAIRDGALEKIDMVNSMCGALSAIDFDNLNKKTIAAGVVGLLLSTQKRGAQGQQGGGTRTEFTEMSGSARLTNGVARNEDLVMSSPVVRARGAGTVNLPADTIDYRAEAELVQSCAGIGQRDLAGQIIPVTISGPIADPKVSPQIPVGLIQALRRSRAESQPATAPQAQPAPSALPIPLPIPGLPPPSQSAEQQPQPAQQQPPAEQRPPSGEDVLRGVLEGLLKKKK